VQVIGISGRPQPKKVITNKSGTSTTTVKAPAKGPTMPNLRDFSGNLSKKGVRKDVNNVRWNETPIGWPDDQTFLSGRHGPRAREAARFPQYAHICSRILGRQACSDCCVQE
jgi:hypothetical protein